jgi:hypothetical protein
MGTETQNEPGGDERVSPRGYSDADGGSGGDLGEGGHAAAGNAGTAVSEATGGDISVGDVNSGGTSGKPIIVYS